MPFWFPAIAAGAAVALVGKAIVRHLNGQLTRSAIDDPEGVRTVARFAAGDSAALLRALAAELTGPIGAPLGVSDDAIRTHAGIDVVRLSRCDDRWSLVLTRAYTGPQLDARALDLLGAIHHALARAGAVGIAWFARQDRELTQPFAHPFY